MSTFIQPPSDADIEATLSRLALSGDAASARVVNGLLEALPTLVQTYQLLTLEMLMAQEANDDALVDQLHEQLDDVYKLCTQEDCAQISAGWTVQLKRCHEIFEASREYRATLEAQAAAGASSIEG